MIRETVLVGAAGTGTSFNIISQLKSTFPNIKIISIDTNAPELVTASLYSDEHYVVARADTDLFENQVREIIRKEAVSVFFPIINGEITLAAKLRAESEHRGLRTMIPGVELDFRNKISIEEFLVEHGIAVPNHYSIGELKNNTSTHFFVKPIDGFGSENATKISRSSLNEKTQLELEQLIIQEVCEGPEITVDSFFDAENQVQLTYCRERLAVKAGVCVKAKIFHSEDLHRLATQLSKVLRQNGTICFQVMRSKGQWVVTDLNFRSGAGTSMTIAAGYDIISANYAVNTGKPYRNFLEPLKPQEVHIVTRQYSDFVMSSEGQI